MLNLIFCLYCNRGENFHGLNHIYIYNTLMIVIKSNFFLLNSILLLIYINIIICVYQEIPRLFTQQLQQTKLTNLSLFLLFVFFLLLLLLFFCFQIFVFLFERRTKIQQKRRRNFFEKRQHGTHIFFRLSKPRIYFFMHINQCVI